MKHVKMFAAVCGLCASATVASASVTLPQGWDIQLWNANGTEQGAAWSAADNPGTWTAEQREGPNGSPIFRIFGSATTADFSFGFDVEFDQDPFISQSFTMTNMTGITQNFTVMTTIPIFPALSAPTLMSGSISGTVGDGDGLMDPNGNGATVTTQANGRPYYEALVDGAGVRELYSAPQVHSAPLNLTSDIDTMNFLNEIGPAANATIGLRNAFTLTAGDNASFTSTFLIVPTPAGVAAIGMLGLASIRRRR